MNIFMFLIHVLLDWWEASPLEGFFPRFSFNFIDFSILSVCYYRYRTLSTSQSGLSFLFICSFIYFAYLGESSSQGLSILFYLLHLVSISVLVLPHHTFFSRCLKNVLQDFRFYTWCKIMCFTVTFLCRCRTCFDHVTRFDHSCPCPLYPASLLLSVTFLFPSNAKTNMCSVFLDLI